MRLSSRYTQVWSVIAILGAWCLAAPAAVSQSPPAHEHRARGVCGKNDSGLKLPAGFCATQAQRDTDSARLTGPRR
jgi:hypothetical protein